MPKIFKYRRIFRSKFFKNIRSTLLILVLATLFWLSYLSFGLTKANTLWKHYLERYFHSAIYRIDTEAPIFNLTKFEAISNDGLLKIYQQQLARLSKSAFLPTYENYRLRLKMNMEGIAKQIYGVNHDLKSPRRQLRITFQEKGTDESQTEDIFSVTLQFNVRYIENDSIDFTLHSVSPSNKFVRVFTIPNDLPNILATDLFLDINQKYSADAQFMFFYQWLDTNEQHSIRWPRWPIRRACAEYILQTLKVNENLTGIKQINCVDVDILRHSTSKHSFLKEKMMTSQWLDIFNNPINVSGLTKTNRRLIPIEKVSSPNICSSNFHEWIDNYQRWHENITLAISDPSLSTIQKRNRVIDLNIRFLLYEKHYSGNADRLVHLITTYLIAILTNRLFLFDDSWPEFFEVMQSSLNYDRDAVFPWFRRLYQLNKGVYRTSSEYLSIGKYFFSFDRLSRDYDYDRQFPERILIFHSHTGATVHTIMSNTSIYRTFLVEQLHMDADNLFGCLFHSLLTYRLAALIEITSSKVEHQLSSAKILGYNSQQLLRILLSTKVYPIGVQVRAGDFFMDKTNKNKMRSYENESLNRLSNLYLGCAYEIIHKNQTFQSSSQIPVVFVLSDTANLRQKALEKYQLPLTCLSGSNEFCLENNSSIFIVANADPVLHITYTSKITLAFRLAMFDIFLFSLCEQHIITTESGFGRVAVFTSIQRRNIYSLMANSNTQYCDSNNSRPLSKSGYDWSGV